MRSLGVMNLQALGIGPKATLFMRESERARTEELGRFAYDAFQRSNVRITDAAALSTSLSRLALAYVSGIDVDRMRQYNVDVVWLSDDQEFPESVRFIERAIVG